MQLWPILYHGAIVLVQPYFFKTGSLTSLECNQQAKPADWKDFLLFISVLPDVRKYTMYVCNSP